MRFRKIGILILTTLTFCLSVSCSKPNGVVPVATPTNSEETPSPSPSEEIQIEATPEAVPVPTPSDVPFDAAEVQGYPWGEGQLYVLAFLGYYPEDCSPNDWAGADFFNEHPVLRGGASLEDTIFRTGDEYFYLLPRYTDAVIRIEEIDTEGRVLGLLWESDWMPVAFGANLSDLYPNTRVTVACAAGSDTFFPMVSLADGGQIPWDEFPGVQGDFTGEWSMVTPDNIIYLLSLWEDGIVDFAAGYVDSEIVWHLHGTYGIVGEESTGDPPAGSFIFNMENVYAGYEDDEEALAAFEPYSVFAAYNVHVNVEGDSLVMTYLLGDELLSQEPTPHLFTRR